MHWLCQLFHYIDQKNSDICASLVILLQSLVSCPFVHETWSLPLFFHLELNPVIIKQQAHGLYQAPEFVGYTSYTLMKSIYSVIISCRSLM